MKLFERFEQSIVNGLAWLAAPFRWTFCAVVGGLALLLGYLFEAKPQTDAMTEHRNFAGRVGAALGILFGVFVSALFGLLVGGLCAIVVGSWLARYLRSDVPGNSTPEPQA